MGVNKVVSDAGCSSDTCLTTLQRPHQSQKQATSAQHTFARPPPTGPSNNGAPRDYRAGRIAEYDRQEQLAKYPSRSDLFPSHLEPTDNYSPRTELFPDRLQQEDDYTSRSDLFPYHQQHLSEYSPRHDLLPHRQQHSNEYHSDQDQYSGHQQQPVNHSAPPALSYEQPAQPYTFQQEDDQELSIRGAAGPFCVVARNFDPGTSAADVESVMQPVGGDIVGSKLVATEPTVVVELLFVSKVGAESVVSTFNNRRVRIKIFGE